MLCKAFSSLEKKISFAASEQNEELHAHYMNQIAVEAPDVNMLVFIDEVAKDWCMSCCQSGQSLQRQCCHGQWYFVHGVCYSIITYDIVKGPVDAYIFCISYKNTLCVWSIFRLIMIADILRCLSLPHIPRTTQCPHHGQLLYSPRWRSLCTCWRHVLFIVSYSRFFFFLILSSL